MSEYDITVHHEQAELQFSIRTAARIARVTESFILLCEDEEIVAIRSLPNGEAGICRSDIKKLKLVRHLHEDLGFRLENIEFVLRLRERLQQLCDRENQLLEAHHRREKELLAEIDSLRRKLHGTM